MKCSCWESAEWVVKWWGCHSNGQTIRTWYEKSNNMNGKMVMGEWCSNWYLPQTALKMSIESIKRIFRCFFALCYFERYFEWLRHFHGMSTDCFKHWDNCCSCKWVVYFLLCERWQQRMQRQCASMYAIYFFFSIFTAHVSSHTNIEHGPFRQSSKGALHTWKPRWLMQILNNKTKEKQKQTIEKAFSLCFYVFQKSIINLTHTHTRNICWVVINNVRFWTHND